MNFVEPLIRWWTIQPDEHWFVLFIRDLNLVRLIELVKFGNNSGLAREPVAEQYVK